MKKIAPRKLWIGDICPYPHVVKTSKAMVLECLGEWRAAEEIFRSNAEVARAAGKDELLAEDLRRLFGVLVRQGRYEEAERLIDEADSIYLTRGDLSGRIRIGNDRAELHKMRGDYARSESLARAQLDLAIQNGDRAEQFRALNIIGVLLCMHGQSAQGAETFARAIEIARDINDAYRLMTAYGNLGLAHYDLNDFDGALKYLQIKLEMARRLGSKEDISSAYGSMGTVYQAKGDYAKALEHFIFRFRTARELGNRFSMAVAANNIAVVSKYAGLYDQAERYYREAINTAREIGARRYLSGFLYSFADLLFTLGRYDEAGAMNAEALSLMDEEDNDDRFQAVVLKIKLEALADRSLAIAALKQMIARAKGDERQAMLHYELYKLDPSEEHRTKAESAYLALYHETGNPRYLKRAEEMRAPSAQG